MFARVAVNTGKALRRSSVRGLLVPAVRALPSTLPAFPTAYASKTRAFSSMAEVLATVCIHILK